MVCTSVVPCLSSSLVKNNKMTSIFVLFAGYFGHLKVCLFSKMRSGGREGDKTLHQSSKTG